MPLSHQKKDRRSHLSFGMTMTKVFRDLLVSCGPFYTDWSYAALSFCLFVWMWRNQISRLDQKSLDKKSYGALCLSGCDIYVQNLLYLQTRSLTSASVVANKGRWAHFNVKLHFSHDAITFSARWMINISSLCLVFKYFSFVLHSPNSLALVYGLPGKDIHVPFVLFKSVVAG